MKFALPEFTPATITHLNVRAEKHGEDVQAALDVKLAIVLGNVVLDQFEPGLLKALYRKDTKQGTLDGIEPGLTDLRFPSLGTLALTSSIEGAQFVVDYGLGVDAGSLVQFDGCKVNAIKVDAQQGGSIALTLRVQASSIPDGALDRLSRLLDVPTSVRIVPPDLAAS